MRSVLSLLCLVVYCAAQQPTPCESPMQWEGRIYRPRPSYRACASTSCSHLEYNTIVEFCKNDCDTDAIRGTLYGYIAYDELYKRVRIVADRERSTGQSLYDTLYLYNIGREYRLDLTTRKCNITQITEPFRPFGVPPFAKFQFEAEIGAAGVPGESLIAETFDGVFQDQTKFVITVTFPDCVPLSSAFYSNTSAVMSSAQFFDIHLGISDPMLFIPPPECNM